MFRNEKKAQEIEAEERYLKALRKVKVPMLTLDARWHQLFPEHLKTRQLSKLEKELNKLIKQQGQAANDIKEYEKARKVLMNNILNNMTDGQESDSLLRRKKQEKNQQLLDELNDKIEEAKALQRRIPRDIDFANQELLIESMRICYETLIANTRNIEWEEEWIRKTREELKEHILVKQEKEIRNTETYKFMHDLLGAKIVEIFDRDHKVWKGDISKEHKADDN